MARPALSDVRNFITISANASDPTRLAATAGNPFLKPAMSDQFDLTAEWYFAKVGSLTFDAFYKDIHHFFYQSVTPARGHQQRRDRDDRRSRSRQFRGERQGQGSRSRLSADVRLPARAAQRVRHQRQLHLYREQGAAQLAAERRLAGQQFRRSAWRATCRSSSSRSTTSHIAGFYEKGPVSLRLAYHWQSRFLWTSADVIFPYFPIFNEAGGQLDGSALFHLTKQVQIGVQAVNLTNSITENAPAVHDERPDRAAPVFHERSALLADPARQLLSEPRSKSGASPATGGPFFFARARAARPAGA
ncbi:MAG: TonB-dependent receptor [Sphingomonas sp.]